MHQLTVAFVKLTSRPGCWRKILPTMRVQLSFWSLTVHFICLHFLVKDSSGNTMSWRQTHLVQACGPFPVPVATGFGRSNSSTSFGRTFLVAASFVESESNKVLQLPLQPQWLLVLDQFWILLLLLFVFVGQFNSCHWKSLKVVDAAIVINQTINMKEIIKASWSVVWLAVMIVCFLLGFLIVVVLATRFVVVEVIVAIS